MKDNAVSKYLRESMEELTKVHWPTKNQAIKLTIIVLGFCLVFGAALTLLDMFLGGGQSLLLDLAS